MTDQDVGQKTNGLHSLLSLPLFYNLVQLAFKDAKTERHFDDLVGTFENKSILDIGCGLGIDSVKYKLAASYTGLDLSQTYIDHAQKTYGSYGAFYCCSIDDIKKFSFGKFDIVLLKGVLHHLTDDQIEGFFLDIKEYLNPNGRVVSVDPTFCEGQSLADFSFRRIAEKRKIHEEASSTSHFGMELIIPNSFFHHMIGYYLRVPFSIVAKIDNSPFITRTFKSLKDPQTSMLCLGRPKYSELMAQTLAD